ncbi:MAG: YbhN family protein [Salinigranum sp.]
MGETRTHVSFRAVLIGFGVAIGVLLVLLYVVGIDRVLAALAAADPTAVLAAVAVALLWIVAWSLSLYLVFGILDIAVPFSRAVLVYTNVLFANNVAPFSVVGAEPVAALFVSRATDTSYETSFAAVMSVDLLNFLPAPALAVLGGIYVAVTSVLGKRIEIVIASLVGLSVVFVIVGYLGWKYRYRLERTAVAVTVSVERRIESVLPGVRLPAPESIGDRVGEVVTTLDLIAANRRVLSVGLVASTAGWVLQATVLWLSLFAVGHRVPIEIPLFVAPLVTVTDLVPLPGGVGSVETALILLLVAVAGVSPTTATAAALVHRGATFLMPLLLGGATTGLVQSSG